MVKKKQNILSASDILGAADTTHETVDVPEWGGTVRVRSLTGAQRDAYEASMVEYKGRKTIWHRKNVRARLVVQCIVDEAGERLFSDSDVDTLGTKSGAALERVFSVAQRLSGLTDADVEELEGNSGSAQSGAST